MPERGQSYAIFTVTVFLFGMLLGYVVGRLRRRSQAAEPEGEPDPVAEPAALDEPLGGGREKPPAEGGGTSGRALEDLTEEVVRLNRLLGERAAATVVEPPTPGPDLPARVHFSVSGGRFHLAGDCHGLRSALRIRELTPCHLCTRARQQ